MLTEKQDKALTANWRSLLAKEESICLCAISSCRAA